LRLQLYATYCITVAKIENYLEELEQEGENVDDVEVVIIPPDVDEVTDEDILKMK
jgi:hypothetical protein